MTTVREDLTCRDLAEFVADWVEGELEPTERARFDAHVAECPDCATYLRTYSDTIRLAKDAHADDPVPADVPEDLVRAILDARPPTRRRR